MAGTPVGTLALDQVTVFGSDLGLDLSGFDFSSFQDLSFASGGFGGGAGEFTPPTAPPAALPAPPPTKPPPASAFVAPIGGVATLLEQVTVTTTAKAAIDVGLVLARGLVGVFGLLLPSNIAAEPDMRRPRVRPPKPETKTETILEQVVVTAPKQKVGRSTSVDYFADVFDTDLDLFSDLQLETPTLWTTEVLPESQPFTQPTRTPKPTQEPRPLSKPLLSPSPLQSLMVPKTKTLVPVLSPMPYATSQVATLLTTGLVPSPSSIPALVPVLLQQLSPVLAGQPSLDMLPTRGRTVSPGPMPAPLESPLEAGQCKPCKCSKEKTKEEKRTKCWVKLTKERADPSRDKSTKWRAIQCQ